MFTIVSPSRQRQLAAAYSALPVFDADAVPAWRTFADETMRQLDGLMTRGLDVYVDDVDPYGSVAEMFDDVTINGRIRVLGTRVTGSHPVLTDDENDAFRAVHDVVGHFGTGRGFDRHGEEAAYQAHARWYSPWARRALATETRGQNAALIYSADGHTFDRQRIAILPAWALAADALVPTEDEWAPTMIDAHRRHIAGGLDRHTATV